MVFVVMPDVALFQLLCDCFAVSSISASVLNDHNMPSLLCPSHCYTRQHC